MKLVSTGGVEIAAYVITVQSEVLGGRIRRVENPSEREEERVIEGGERKNETGEGRERKREDRRRERDKEGERV